MQSFTGVKLSVLVLVCCSFLTRWTEATITLQLVHRFSHKAKEHRFAQQMSEWPFPEPETTEYHKFLLDRDFARHGRMLATTPGSYTFLEGNFTLQLFGGLFYATIDVGTPAVPFLVALDTGSDLFWLPCECQSCAPATSPVYQDYDITNPLNVYTPSKSNTSKSISCASDDCHLYINQCVPNGGSQCQYRVNYASVNTSTSGRLVEDVLHLVPNSGEQTPTTVPIILGCGQVQTGSFLDGYGAPDGLIGLGLQDYSVPASLAKSGLVKDSFSMCFHPDGSGRVIFGDLGSKTQKITPFLSGDPDAYETYFVGLESIDVGTESIPVGEAALFDTGTTYTYLNSSYYQALVASFAKQTSQYARIPVGTEAIQPWELCYLTSDDSVTVPSIDFVLRGKAPLSIRYPFVPLIYTNQTQAGFCLALFESNANIIGANFMIGHNLVFNREDLTLGFEEANCYDVTADSGSSPSIADGPIPTPAQKPPSSAPSSTPGDTSPSVLSPPPRSPSFPSPSSEASATSFSLVALLSLGLVHFFL